jgi:hypothetical protein
MTQSYKCSNNPKDECFREQCGNWKKYLQEEGNPMGMEKLMDCLAAYIDKCDSAILSGS